MLVYAFICAIYGIMLIVISIITKLNDQLFSYSPLYITLFYINIFYPINVIKYVYFYKINRLKLLTKHQFYAISIPAILYTIESIFTYWALLYVPMSFYITGRTCTAFINVIFSKYYLKKIICYYYYAGLAFLLCSYTLFLVSYSNNNMNINEILSICVVFISCLTTSIYNNMAEKFFDDINISNNYSRFLNDDINLEAIGDNGNDNDNDKDNHIEIHEMQLIYQLIFSLYGFLITMPVALALAIHDKNFTSNIAPNILYAVAGIFFQTNIGVKIFILSSTIYSGNQILTGVDLFRRVITNIIAYIWFNDPWNVEIIFANITMIIGCCFIAFGALKNKEH